MSDKVGCDDLTIRLMNVEEELADCRKNNEKLVADLMRKSAELSDAEDTLKRWRAELELVASKKGHNLCHIWIPELLKRTLGNTGGFPDPEGMTKDEFRLGCKIYQDDIFGPDKNPVSSGLMFGRRAVFLDRDGTLIQSVIRPDFIKKVTAPFSKNELSFDPKVGEALDLIKRVGFLRIMITNQPDVRHGYMPEDEWLEIHDKVVGTLDLDDFHMCRHLKGEDCPFKKPLSAMLLSMADKWGINLRRSYMIGDTDADMRAGKSAGCKTILIDKPYNQNVACDIRAKDLFDAARIVAMGAYVKSMD